MITPEEMQRAVANLAEHFDPNAPQVRTPEEKAFRERLQKVARGEANWTELRETLSELAVADFYGRRKDGSSMPAGSVTAGLDAAAQRATNPEDVAAIGKVSGDAARDPHVFPRGFRHGGRAQRSASRRRGGGFRCADR